MLAPQHLWQQPPRPAVGALLAAPQLAQAPAFPQTIVALAFDFVAAGSVSLNRAALAVGFLCALSVSAVNRLSVCPPLFLCALCVKSFDLLQPAQSHYPHAETQKNQPRNRNQTSHHQHSRNPAQNKKSARHSSIPPPRTKHSVRHARISTPPPQNAPAPTRRNFSPTKRPIDKPRRTSDRHVESPSGAATKQQAIPLQNPRRTRTSSLHLLPPIRKNTNLLRLPPHLPLRQIPHHL